MPGEVPPSASRLLISECPINGAAGRHRAAAARPGCRRTNAGRPAQVYFAREITGRPAGDLSRTDPRRSRAGRPRRSRKQRQRGRGALRRSWGLNARAGQWGHAVFWRARRLLASFWACGGGDGRPLRAVRVSDACPRHVLVRNYRRRCAVVRVQGGATRQRGRPDHGVQSGRAPQWAVGRPRRLPLPDAAPRRRPCPGDPRRRGSRPRGGCPFASPVVDDRALARYVARLHPAVAKNAPRLVVEERLTAAVLALTRRAATRSAPSPGVARPDRPGRHGAGSRDAAAAIRGEHRRRRAGPGSGMQPFRAVPGLPRGVRLRPACSIFGGTNSRASRFDGSTAVWSGRPASNP